jgi:hypothetical protein
VIYLKWNMDYEKKKIVGGILKQKGILALAFD